ncbi:glycosyltransferase [Rhodohalobacter sp. SW132]|uniref:glycosyltransferase family 2 protein n=1 Tax=Rhodohalobacter sp. SW132 TaxID=2293433 RepID=UPI000E255992|nr:glycosyltransferase [Rhodohalobacter sp. SW132]REL24170.1 glycosyltransferase [Rhodohalobacter sp. SW132]
MPKVTVLMPVYNAEKYLREAIDSILNQSFTDFEFLIIDDGSTDSSLDIINSYTDDRIRLVINDQNMGIGATLNKGIELASSDLIARMDADDISLPDRLEKQYTYLEAHPECSLLSSNVEVISETGERLYLYQRDSKLFYFNLTFYCWIYHPSVMYKRRHVIDAGMYPSTFSEDYRLWSKLIRKYLIHNLDDILIKYRITNQSVSNSVLAEEYRATAIEQTKENLRYFVGENYTIPDDWLEAYRNHFDPLCNPPRVKDMASCINELDVITPHILKKDNINRDENSIKLAAKMKKEHLLKSFLKKIPTKDKVPLLIQTGNFNQLAKFLSSWSSNKLKDLF